MAPTAKHKHAAIALCSAAVVLLQIALTRVLSVLLWYHWAFFSVSLTMLGLGAPGVWMALRPPRSALARRLSVGAAVAVPAGTAALVQLAHHFGSWAIVWALATMLPAMLCLGGVVCALLIDAAGPTVGRRYGYDLLGACVGALSAVPLMWLLPTPALCALSGLLPLGAALLLGPARRLPILAVGGAIAATAIWGVPYQVRHTKLYQEGGPRFAPMWVRWTPTARLAVFPSYPWSDGRAGFRWGLGTRAAASSAPPERWLEQDGSAGTPIVHFAGDWNAVQYLLDDVTTVGLQLVRPRRVAIVGGGGGRDILSAKLTGAEQIAAIELNAGIVTAMRGRFAAYSGGVYDLPGVAAIVGEGRSVLSRSLQRYDLILISMIDSWAATAAGAYALSENNLYTVQAYRSYWRHLSEHGAVSTSRWGGMETMRLVLLAQAALRAEGVARPRQHLALLRAGKVATLLMTRPPVTGQLATELGTICAARGFTVLYAGRGDGPAATAVERVLRRGPALLASSGFDLSPPTDDRPFFFQMLSPLAPLPATAVAQGGFNAEGVAALQKLLVIMTLLTVLLFFAPLAVGHRLPAGPHRWRASALFTAIGLGFMLVEMSLLERFILYLGHPSHATAATVGCMLLGAGLGAHVATRLGVARLARYGWLLGVALGALALGLGPLFAATLRWPLAARVCTAGALLVPVSFGMGLFFPLGLVRYGDAHKPWLWALNAAAGVLASVASLALAMQIGLLRVGLLGAGLYLLAWLLFGPRARLAAEHASLGA